MKKVVFILTLFISLGWLNETKASHLAGGDIQYRYIGDSTGIANQYRIIVRLYRDVQGINMPTSIPVSVCSSCYPTQSVTCPLTGGGPGSIAPTLFDCVDQGAPGTVTMEIYIYKGIVTLPGLCSDWKFAYNTCCRNGAVQNITASSSQAFYIEAKLNNFLGNNTSPFFVSEPVRAFCVGQLFNWKQSAVEPDNDSINYTIVSVRGNTSNCTFNNLSYAAGWTPLYPIRTTPPQSLTINPKSGVITFVPSNQEIDVMAVVVEEYRFDSTYFQWVKIGESNRDMQITVSPNCSNLAQQGVILNYNFLGTYPDPISGLPTVDYTCLDSAVTLNFAVKLDCSTISPDGTDFRLTAPDGQPIPVKEIIAVCDANNETQQLLLKLHKPLAFNGYYYLYSKTGNDGNTLLNKCGFPMAEFDTIQLKVQGCFTTQMDMKNVTIENDEYPRVQWLLDTIGTALAPFPKYLVDQYKIYRRNPGQPNYFLLYTINDYKNMQFDDKSLSWPDVDANSYSYKVEVVVNSTPAVLTRGVHSILLKSKIDPIAKPDTIDLVWSSYNGWPAASYTVELGSEVSGVYNWAAHSNPLSPVNPTNDTTYMMLNENLQPGNYAIRIKADYPGGAGPYTAYSNWIKFVVYEPPVVPPPTSDSLVVPNVLTPNNDGVNDFFEIENIMSWPTTRHVRIFNRWGGIVYENEMYDNNMPWDGTDKSGKKLSDGTYFYTIEVVNQPTNKSEIYTGNVTLIGSN